VRKGHAATASALFFAVAPGMVAGVIPWLITRWEMRQPFAHWPPFRLIGAALILVGIPVLIHAFVRFVRDGSGTPAPVAPTVHLVVGGLYRYVRNVMYLAVLSTIVGQACLLGQGTLLVYAAVIALFFALFVRLYEEPTLARRFGAEYEAYRQAVPGWRPRLRPWSPNGR